MASCPNEPAGGIVTAPIMTLSLVKNCAPDLFERLASYDDMKSYDERFINY